MAKKMCESCGEKEGVQLVRGILKQLYCMDCAIAYGMKNWVEKELKEDD